MFIGFFFVTSIIVLSSNIREKKEYFNKNERSYIIPTLYRLIKNKPFISLLIPWVIDLTIGQIYATMLPFFIIYITNPHKNCIDKKIDTSSEFCSPNSWLGITIFSFFVFCIGSIFLWHFIVKYVGKKKAWQSYSMLSVVTFSLFLMCDQGMMQWLVIFSIINSIPAGGAYINDVMLSDIIDYDEFITGKRNEGIFMVFTSFIPKVVGIVAQSIPLTVMACKNYLFIY
jgi:Na+/melibiose symporter-like transporter